MIFLRERSSLASPLARPTLRRCTICDPISLGLGLAASAGGNIWSQQDAFNNAKRQANAENGVLSTAINGLDQDYGNMNAPALQSPVAGTPTAASLKGAQDARTAAIEGNISAPTVGGPPTTPGAPPAVNAAKAADMKTAFNRVTDQARATGNLGGYGDSWFNSGLADSAAGRNIGVGNAYADEEKSLIAPEQQLAGAAAYRPPSILGQALQGLGSALGSYAGKNVSPNGAQLPFGIGRLFAPTPSDMLSGMYSPSGSSGGSSDLDF
jgi:hypothetical protein